MTRREALPDGDLASWPYDGSDGVDDYAAYDAHDDTYEDDTYEDDLVWDDYPARQVPVRPAMPWYRSPAMLLMLIGLAAAILVIAAALLVTGRNTEKIPVRPRLETSTSAPVPSTRTPSAAPKTATSTSSPPSTTEESGEPINEQVAPAPNEPAPSTAAPPPASASRSPQGPKINVTRTPMSFTPGKPG